MKKIKNLIKTTFIGGIGVVLPILLSYLVFHWLLNTMIGLLKPVTKLIADNYFHQETVAVVLAVLIVSVSCFALGLLIKTRLGKYIYKLLEEKILTVAPGYKLFKETTRQFLSSEEKPFSKVALVKIFENETLCTGFVSDTHPDGSYTVFVPSGLNPTSGMIYHLKPQFVQIMDISTEEAMQTVIACGAGSSKFFESSK